MNESLSPEDREKVEQIAQRIEEQGGAVEEIWSEGDYYGSRIEITFRI